MPKITNWKPYEGKIIESVKAGVPAAQIHRELFPDQDNAEISLRTLTVYIQKLKESIAPAAAEILEEHVRKELPKDLEMLEDIQMSSYMHSKEFHFTQPERVSEAALKIAGKLEEWIAVLTNSDKPQKVVKWIIREVASYIQSDVTRIDTKLKLQEGAMKALGLKFKTGLGEVEAKGDIIFVSHKDVREEVKPDGIRAFTVHRGGKNG